MLGAEHASFEESDGLVVSGRLLGPRAPDLVIAALKVIGREACRAYDAAAGGLLRLRRWAAVTIGTTYSKRRDASPQEPDECSRPGMG